MFFSCYSLLKTILLYEAIYDTAYSDVMHQIDKKLCEVLLAGTHMALPPDKYNHNNLQAILVMNQYEEAVMANYCYLFII